MSWRWGRCPWMQSLPISKYPTFLHCSAVHGSGTKGERRIPPFLSQCPTPRETLPTHKHRRVCQLCWIRNHVFWHCYLTNALFDVYSYLCIWLWRCLHWGMQDLWFSFQRVNPWWWNVGPSSPTGDRTWAPCPGSGEAATRPPGCPNTVIFNEKTLSMNFKVLFPPGYHCTFLDPCRWLLQLREFLPLAAAVDGIHALNSWWVSAPIPWVACFWSSSHWGGRICFPTPRDLLQPLEWGGGDGCLSWASAPQDGGVALSTRSFVGVLSPQLLCRCTKETTGPQTQEKAADPAEGSRPPSDLQTLTLSSQWLWF